MGNCTLKGVTDTAKGTHLIRLMTDSGEILKLKSPKLVGEVLHSFPGYKIFGQGHFSTPLFDHEELLAGKFYYLLPLLIGDHQSPKEHHHHHHHHRQQHQNQNQEPEAVRVSSAAIDLVSSFVANGSSAVEVLDPPQKGVWRVKLAISPKQLEEILAEEVNTEALIEQMRMAAAAAAAASASSSVRTITPRRRRTKSYLGGLIWKPILANVFLPKSTIDNNQEDEQVQTVDIYTNTQAKPNDLITVNTCV